MKFPSWFKSPSAASDSDSRLKSCLCTERTLLSPEFQQWAPRLGEAPGHLHRKVWEWCFICQALQERGLLVPGKTGLGFAVGQEPLSALFATYGVNILATDLFSEQAMARGWVETDQHADGYAAMNKKGICDDALLRERVKFTFADMNNIGREWDNSFDFVWSACAFEHLGSLEHGMQFIINAMNCLKPGGFAVHTTEFNVSSNFATVATGETVLYRRRDIQELEKRLKKAGHRIELDFSPGTTHADKFVDVPPYAHATHLKLKIDKFVATSIGLIVQKAQ